jgi:hypothetical protein
LSSFSEPLIDEPKPPLLERSLELAGEPGYRRE